jgi:heme/copper-type cytochrome/quinol oxidase subunit 3
VKALTSVTVNPHNLFFLLNSSQPTPLLITTVTFLIFTFFVTSGSCYLDVKTLFSNPVLVMVVADKNANIKIPLNAVNILRVIAFLCLNNQNCNIKIPRIVIKLNKPNKPSILTLVNSLILVAHTNFIFPLRWLTKKISIAECDILFRCNLWKNSMADRKNKHQLSTWLSLNILNLSIIINLRNSFVNISDVSFGASKTILPIELISVNQQIVFGSQLAIDCALALNSYSPRSKQNFIIQYFFPFKKGFYFSDARWIRIAKPRVVSLILSTISYFYPLIFKSNSDYVNSSVILILLNGCWHLKSIFKFKHIPCPLFFTPWPLLISSSLPLPIILFFFCTAEINREIKISSSNILIPMDYLIFEFNLVNTIGSTSRIFIFYSSSFNIIILILFLSEAILFLSIFWGQFIMLLSPNRMYPSWVILPSTCELTSTGSFLLSHASICGGYGYTIRDKFLSSSHSTSYIILVSAENFISLQMKEFRNLGFLLNNSIYGCLFFFLTTFHFIHLVVGILLLGLYFGNYFLFQTHFSLRLFGISVQVFPQLEYFIILLLYWHFIEFLWLVIDFIEGLKPGIHVISSLFFIYQHFLGQNHQPVIFAVSVQDQPAVIFLVQSGFLSFLSRIQRNLCHYRFLSLLCLSLVS